MAVIEKNLKVDSKKRITIGKLAPDDVTSYDAELLKDGIIILKPKVEVPAEEAWLFRNRNALESVKKGLEESATGKVSDLEDEFWNDIEE